MKTSKQKKSQASRLADEAALKNQMRLLEFKDVNDYKNWCNQYGFSAKIDKTAEQYQRELVYFQNLKKLVKVEKTKKPKNIKRILKDYLDGKNYKDYNALDTNSHIGFGSLISFYNKIQDKVFKPQVRSFIITLINDANLFEALAKGGTYAMTVRTLATYLDEIIAHYDQWVRDPSKWRAKSHNTYRQFTSLLHHFFCLYDVPAFMDKAWLNEGRTATTVARTDAFNPKIVRYWYIHMGKGKNIRTADHLPIPFTKKMSHFFCKAPSNYNLIEAMRYGQVLALGGDQRLVEGMRDSLLFRSTVFYNNEFWESVIRWFAAQPMFDYAHATPIIDYLNNQKFENRNVVVDGILRTEGPSQPHLSMNKREPEALLRQVEDWHTRLGREKKAGTFKWVHNAISDFELWEGAEGTPNRKLWTIRELCSSSELRTEGSKMKHCVYSYAHSCHAGKSSIWAMGKTTNEGTSKLLTIEVNNLNKTIVQVRGKFNGKASTQEMNIISKWAAASGLKLGSWFN